MPTFLLQMLEANVGFEGRHTTKRQRKGYQIFQIIGFFFFSYSQDFLMLLLYVLSKYKQRWCLKLLPVQLCFKKCKINDLAGSSKSQWLGNYTSKRILHCLSEYILSIDCFPQVINHASKEIPQLLQTTLIRGSATQ